MVESKEELNHKQIKEQQKAIAHKLLAESTVFMECDVQ